jgi:hypothetical protein
MIVSSYALSNISMFIRINHIAECLTASSVVKKHLLLLQSGEALTRF